MKIACPKFDNQSSGWCRKNRAIKKWHKRMWKTMTKHGLLRLYDLDQSGWDCLRGDGFVPRIEMGYSSSGEGFTEYDSDSLDNVAYDIIVNEIVFKILVKTWKLDSIGCPIIDKIFDIPERALPKMISSYGKNKSINFTKYMRKRS